MSKKSLIAEIKQMKKEYIAEYGKEPQEIYAKVKWEDGEVNECQTIRVNDDSQTNDNEVLFYCGNWNEVFELCAKNNLCEFQITNVIGMGEVI